MKILNLYAGIGGNRQDWGTEHDITAIEIDPGIAKIYQDFYPGDKVIVADAHEYLLNHFKKYDFIWSSPPCQTHSRCNYFLHARGHIKYPDMGLYQEIILLKQFCKCKWLIENVRPYYDYLIRPTQIIHRHVFWSNFYIGYYRINDNRIITNVINSSVIYGYDLSDYKIKNKSKMLKDMVNPEIGKYILEQAMYKRELF